MKKKAQSLSVGLLFSLTFSVMTSFFNTGCATRSGLSVGSSTLPDQDIVISGKEEASKEVMANISRPYVSPLGEIALDVTPLTQQWIRYFQGRGRKYMEVYLQRSSRYLPMMKNTLREKGLPEDLVYIALIESGFSPLAHSHANAVGYWQFIRPTGKRFGLMIDPFIDERRDPVLSTRAAAEYFKALYAMFNSWHLSMASYNVGENRVARVTAKYRTRDFWELIKNKRALPKETKHYVPKFIAAALIAKNPAQYGFTEIEYESPLSFDTVKLTNPVSMTRLAQISQVDVEELKLLNPKFRGDYVPQYRGSETLLRVPVGRSSVVTAAITQAYSDAPKVIAAEHFFYRVKRGDTLSTIARKNRTSVAKLKSLNGFGSRTFLRVGQRLKVPDRGGNLVTYEMPAYPAPASPLLNPVDANEQNGDSAESDVDDRAEEILTKSESNDRQAPDDEEDTVASQQIPLKHVVRRGENLTLIAKKYGISIGELRRLNRLGSRTTLKVGQTLRVKLGEEDEAPQSNAAQGRRSSKDKVSKIAGAQKSKSLRMGLKSNSNSQVSAKKLKRNLSVSERAKRDLASLKRHRVRRGETLAEIASRYRVTVGAIAKRNQIKNRSELLAGAELIIPRN